MKNYYLKCKCGSETFEAIWNMDDILLKCSFCGKLLWPCEERDRNDFVRGKEY